MEGGSFRCEMDRGRKRKREDEGEVEANHSILEASDRQTDRQLLEVMASSMIKHVNRSHSHRRARVLPAQTRIQYIHQGKRHFAHTQASNRGTDKHRQMHAYLRQTDRHTQLPFDHNTSASITASAVPLSPSLCSRCLPPDAQPSSPPSSPSPSIPTPNH